MTDAASTILASWHAAWFPNNVDEQQKKNAYVEAAGTRNAGISPQYDFSLSIVHDAKRWLESWTSENEVQTRNDPLIDSRLATDENGREADLGVADFRGRRGRLVKPRVPSTTAMSEDFNQHEESKKIWSEIIYPEEDSSGVQSTYSFEVGDDDNSVSVWSVRSGDTSLSNFLVKGAGSGLQPELFSVLSDDMSTVCSRETVQYEENDVGDSPSVPHLLSIQEMEKQEGADLPVTLSLLNKPHKKVKTLKDDIDGKRSMYLERLRLLIDQFGRTSYEVADVLVCLGEEVYERIGDYDRALRLYNEALSIYTVKVGDHDSVTVDVRIRIGQVQFLLGDFDDSLNNFCYTLSFRQALLGGTDPLVSDAWMYVSSVHHAKGQLELALKDMKKALRGYRLVFGDNNSTVAAVVEDIAALYSEMGNHEKANLIFPELVKLRATITNNKHPDVADALLAWAASLEAVYNYRKALVMTKKAYNIYINSRGQGDHSSTMALERVARLYSLMDEKEKAARAFYQVTKTKKWAMGSHPQVADSFVDLGTAYAELRELEKGLKCLKRAIEIYAEHSGHASALMDTVHQIATMHHTMGQPTYAMKAFHRFLAMQRGTEEYESSPKVAQALHAIGTIHFNWRNYDKALDAILNAVAIHRRVGSQGSVLGDILFDAGVTYEKKGNDQEAQCAYVEAYQTYRSQDLHPLNHPRMAKVLSKVSSIQIDNDVLWDR